MTLRCLVTGATGYLGGRLVPELLAAGHTVRCLARTPARLNDRPWADRVEAVRGDVTDPASVRSALEGIEVAYYLVHALGGRGAFEEIDREAAHVFAAAARDAGVRRLVYAGALTPEGVPERELSPHLRSRAEVGHILLDSGVPTAVLRAAVVIGSGSASFEMLRQLGERLPVMVTPRWVRTRVQPVAVRDMLRVLAGSAELPADVNRAFDVGGPDVVTYETMLRRYAVRAGLRRRLIVPVPVLTPGLSSLWVGLVTPLPGRLARPLVESLRHEVVCRERDIERYVPPPPGAPLGLDAALDAALDTTSGPTPDLSRDRARARARERPGERPGSREREREREVESVPGGSRDRAPADAAAGPLPSDPAWAGGSLYTDRRERAVDTSPEALWRVVEGIGGENGWYSSPVAWAVRGWLDSLVGGGGLRRGRRDAARLRVGDALDFWRVEALEPERLLRLRGEMRVPGTAWLELCVDRDDEGRTVYRQRALFHPRGLAGHAYWWAVAPFHAWVFGGMVRTITSTAQAEG
ncbi:SDR family oxidoreductase [Streptomyces marincola]|uniref:SDR family oxidoreductase n=1 Tax=Streptomyces marincola TaxID=2878388 RepID=UPI001CF2E2EB|nr:SDR family oxidoreductase [Streptomyces marincola]UCM89227.1 SDR family oxidoreductase [Streptomyces marincola]